MIFRFPHSAENIGEAVRDAINPDTPTGGGLVEQLMNENNRAVEDAIHDVAKRTPTDPPDELFYGTSVSGDFYDVLDPLVATLELPEGHLWEVKARIEGSVTATSSAAVRSFIVFMDSVHDPAIYGTDFFLPQAHSRFTATGTAGGYTITDAYVFESGVAQGSFTVSTFVGGGGVTVNSASAALVVEARWLRALVPGDTP